MLWYQFCRRAASFSLLPAQMSTEGCRDIRLTCWRISTETVARNASSAGYMEQAYIMSCHIRMPNSSAIYSNTDSVRAYVRIYIFLDIGGKK